MLEVTKLNEQQNLNQDQENGSSWKVVWLILGLVFGAIGFSFCVMRGLDYGVGWTVGVTVLCAVWWVSEAVPIPVTSLVPFAVFPLVGVLSHSEVATAYGHTFILLFMAGFMLSKAAERTLTHRKIAGAVLSIVGGHTGSRIILGFMIATAFCSMWISNTATAVMMLPVAIAVLEDDKDNVLGVPLLLGIAYAASIGGMATTIGTPPNIAMLAVYQQGGGREIAFHEWMVFGLPTALILLAITWVYLSRGVKLKKTIELPTEKGWSKAQKRVLIVLACTALLWITRALPGIGWSKLTGITTAGDSTVALLAVIVMFIVPSGERKGQRLLDWKTAVSIPWGILLLFGGGLAIAKAFTASGLSAVVAEELTVLEGLPVFWVVLVICLVITFITEVTSNTATANVFLPIVMSAAVAMEIDPLLLMVPAAMSASCAFMLPVATPPNAVVFGAGQLHIRDMAKKGLALNLIAVVVISFMSWLLLKSWVI
ncbi:SLC13/DASS family transporter [Planctomycetota bacterium]|nr:SLC13/DASS family transporter [Planctomycetota bacterium]